jgi:hypothetical protein
MRNAAAAALVFLGGFIIMVLEIIGARASWKRRHQATPLPTVHGIADENQKLINPLRQVAREFKWNCGMLVT